MKIKLISILLIASPFAKAQVTYSVSPSRTVVFTALVDQLNGSAIYQLNTGTKKILLKWKRLSVDIPAGWAASICDNISCFGDIPAGSTMDSVAANEKGFLILDIDPGTIRGAGVVKMYVYQDGYDNMGDTLTWKIISSAVGIEKFSVTDPVSIYPNPAKELLHIDLKGKRAGVNSGYVVDMLGKEVMHIPLLMENNTIYISGFNAGCYYVIIESTVKQLIIDNE